MHLDFIMLPGSKYVAPEKEIKGWGQFSEVFCCVLFWGFFCHADIGTDLFQNQARNSSFHSIMMSQERHTDCLRSKVATSAPTILCLRLIYESPRGMHMGCILPISQLLGLWTRPQRAVFTRNFAAFKTSDSSSRMFMKCLSAAS